MACNDPECLIADLGDPRRFRDAAELASYVGVVPRLRQVGNRAFSGARRLLFGNAPAASPVDADLGRRPEKPLVAGALRPSVDCGQAPEGRDRGLSAEGLAAVVTSGSSGHASASINASAKGDAMIVLLDSVGRLRSEFGVLPPDYDNSPVIRLYDSAEVSVPPWSSAG